MARASYLQQTARRVVGGLPILRPARLLFRPSEAALTPMLGEDPLAGGTRPTAHPSEPASVSTPLTARRNDQSPSGPLTSDEQPETTPVPSPVPATRAPLTPRSRPAEAQAARPLAGPFTLREEQADSTGSNDLKPIKPILLAAAAKDHLIPAPKVPDGSAAPAIAAAGLLPRNQAIPLRPAPRRTPEKKDGTAFKRVLQGMDSTRAEPTYLQPRKPELPPPAPKAEHRQKASIHIGSIEVQIVPASPPAPRPRTQTAQPQPASSLSRGFTSPFGIRQG